jgi:glycosyltransferase involved in cell wall biosynthesis
MTADQPPLVTIGIPTYNRSDSYLRETLSSALNQTYDNIEIIVSDNCSSDGTENYVRGLNNPRIRYFRHDTNIGPHNNFNYCLKQSRGAYFLLLHDDDLIDGDFVESCMAHANYATDIAIIQTGTRVIDSVGNILSESLNNAVDLSTEDYFRALFAAETSWYLCCTLFNTRQLREIGGFQSKRNLVQDGVAIVKLAAKSRIVIIRDIKASFRKHPDEITFAVKVRDWCEDYLALLDLMCDLVNRDHEFIRSEGMRFLCQINYNRTRAIVSPIRRFFTYLMVYRMFNYSYSPLNYLVLPHISSIKRRIRKAAGYAIDIFVV